MFKPVKLGDHVKPVAIERYKAEERTKDIVSIPTRNISVAAMHYVQGVGMIYCFEGQCCQDNGLPNLRYLVPLLIYGTVTDIRNRQYGGPLKIQYVPLNDKDYSADILTKDELHAATHRNGIADLDLLITCQDSNFQKLRWEVVGPAKWRTDPTLNEQAKALWADYTRLIELSASRRVTPEKYNELLALAAKREVGSTRTPSAPAPHPRHAAPALAAPATSAPPLADLSPDSDDMGMSAPGEIAPINTPPQVTDTGWDDLIMPDATPPGKTEPAAAKVVEPPPSKAAEPSSASEASPAPVKPAEKAAAEPVPVK